MTTIELRSSAFSAEALIPRRCTKDGDNVSPALGWSGIPDGTAELVLMCEDPDAPTGTFLHWLVTGIDPDSSGVDSGQTPPGGVPRANGYRERGWGGPHPPAGDSPHRYIFRLYAMPYPLTLPEGASADEVHRAIDGRQLAQAALVGLYQR